MPERMETKSKPKVSKETYFVASHGAEAKATLLRPEKFVSEVPVFVAGGWSVSRRTLEGVGEEITKSGREALLIDHARFGRPQADGAYPAETVQKANSMLNAMDKSGTKKTDVIAHSEGALASIYAALEYPERFRSLILVAPAGMIGEDSVKELAGRFLKKQRESLTKDLPENPTAVGRIMLGGAKYIGKNPAKAYREVSNIANEKADEILRELRQRGVYVGLIQSNADPLFPPERIEKHVELDDGRWGNVDSYASIANKNAGHDDLLIHPEQTARAAIQMIEDFERTPPIKHS